MASIILATLLIHKNHFFHGKDRKRVTKKCKHAHISNSSEQATGQQPIRDIYKELTTDTFRMTWSVMADSSNRYFTNSAQCLYNTATNIL